MTEQELRNHYKTAYRVLAGERMMRLQVFPEGHPKRAQKLGEIDSAMAAISAMKNFAKQHTTPDTHQAALFDESERVERKGGY